MRFRLSFELRVQREPKIEPDEPQPEGSEAMVIHQDQPRYIGFRREDEISGE